MRRRLVTAFCVGALAGGSIGGAYATDCYFPWLSSARFELVSVESATLFDASNEQDERSLWEPRGGATMTVAGSHRSITWDDGSVAILE